MLRMLRNRSDDLIIATSGDIICKGMGMITYIRRISWPL